MFGFQFKLGTNFEIKFNDLTQTERKREGRDVLANLLLVSTFVYNGYTKHVLVSLVKGKSKRPRVGL